jgi:hypothetical protein
MLQRRDSGNVPKTSGTSNLRFASFVDYREVVDTNAGDRIIVIDDKQKSWVASCSDGLHTVQHVQAMGGNNHQKLSL